MKTKKSKNGIGGKPMVVKIAGHVHQRLKLEAVSRRVRMQQATEEAIELWLKQPFREGATR